MHTSCSPPHFIEANGPVLSKKAFERTRISVRDPRCGPIWGCWRGWKVSGSFYHSQDSASLIWMRTLISEEFRLILKSSCPPLTSLGFLVMCNNSFTACGLNNGSSILFEVASVFTTYMVFLSPKNVLDFSPAYRGNPMLNVLCVCSAMNCKPNF